MRSFLKSIQSSLNRKIEKRIKRKRLIKEFSNLSNQDVFEKIYHERLWGGSESDEGFYSGQGSHKPEIVEPYIKKVKEFIMQNNDIKTAADLGCGDFNIGSKLFNLFELYYAIDVSPSIIKQNKTKYKNKKIKFLCSDITCENLPEADIVFIRQVLQHLSNDDIHWFLSNLNQKYKYLLVTETVYKTDNFIPNKDINTGPSVRYQKKSGVDLTKQPFNLKVCSEETLCKVVVGTERIVSTLYRLN